jgi:hypothetical protein
MLKETQLYEEISDLNALKDCLNRIKQALSGEELDESNKDEFYRLIQCLKKYEEELRSSRQALETRLRLYNNKVFIKKLREGKEKF